MCCLLLADGMVQFAECLVPVIDVRAGKNVKSNQQDHCEFPRNVERSALDNYKLHRGEQCLQTKYHGSKHRPGSCELAVSLA